MIGIDWIPAAAGGVMIGLSAALFFWINGRIAGISGIFGDAFLDRGRSAGQDRRWRLAFLVGLLLGCMAMRMALPSTATIQLQTGTLGMVVAGLLVGFGTRMGCGCTSGHGICGMARLSRRSIVATLVFMGTAMFTVLALRYLGLRG